MPILRSILLFLALAFIAPATHAVEPFHTLLTLPLPNRSPRVHRFRLPVSQLEADVVDLHYETLLGDALGDADLVVNGGYWGYGNDSKRRIIGLLRVGGKEWSPLRAALDGGVFVLHGGKASVSASRGYQGPAQPELAVQCSPRLVQNSALIPNLKPSGRAARTGVCVRDAGNTLDVYLTEPEDLGPSLADFARWLLAQGCEHALNLDGGPSTAAAFRENGKVVRIGPGEALPYAIRFKHTK